MERFPAATLIEVASHARIPELFADEALAADWLRMKRDVLVLGVKKGLALRPNGRSADFIAPSTSNGCAMACSYCYVPRRKGYANPVTIFVNVEAISAAIARHAAKLGPKTTPNSVDPVDWVYDLGENGDLSADATITGAVRPRFRLPRHPERQGLVRHEAREPRAAGLRPAGADAHPILADA